VRTPRILNATGVSTFLQGLESAILVQEDSSYRAIASINDAAILFALDAAVKLWRCVCRIIVPSSKSGDFVMVVGNGSSIQPRTCREPWVVMTAFRWSTLHMHFPEPVFASEECASVSILVAEHALRFALDTLVRFGHVARDDGHALRFRIPVAAAWIEKLPLSVLADLDAVVAAVVESQASLLAFVALGLSALDCNGRKNTGTITAG